MGCLASHVDDKTIEPADPETGRAESTEPGGRAESTEPGGRAESTEPGGRNTDSPARPSGVLRVVLPEDQDWWTQKQILSLGKNDCLVLDLDCTVAFKTPANGIEINIGDSSEGTDARDVSTLRRTRSRLITSRLIAGATVSAALSELRERGVKVFFLTAQAFSEKNLADVRALGLHDSGLDRFDSRIATTSVRVMYSGVFMAGSHSTKGISKGLALRELVEVLMTEKEAPHNVVFVDDESANVDSVVKELECLVKMDGAAAPGNLNTPESQQRWDRRGLPRATAMHYAKGQAVRNFLRAVQVLTQENAEDMDGCSPVEALRQQQPELVQRAERYIAQWEE